MLTAADFSKSRQLRQTTLLDKDQWWILVIIGIVMLFRRLLLLRNRLFWSIQRVSHKHILTSGFMLIQHSFAAKHGSAGALAGVAN